MEDQEKKTYNINGRNFSLKESLTLAERAKISKQLKTFRFSGGDVVSEMSLSDLCNFFAVILRAEDKQDVKAEFFGQLDEAMELEVVADFFIQRLALTNNLVNLLKNWRRNLYESKKILTN